jgi:hypothetical protein
MVSKWRSCAKLWRNTPRAREDGDGESWYPKWEPAHDPPRARGDFGEFSEIGNLAKTDRAA